MLTKQQRLVLYLTSHGSIDSDAAKEVCEIKNLRAEISRLRSMGYQIATDTQQDKTVFYLLSRTAR